LLKKFYLFIFLLYLEERQLVLSCNLFSWLVFLIGMIGGGCWLWLSYFWWVDWGIIIFYVIEMSNHTAILIECSCLMRRDVNKDFPVGIAGIIGIFGHKLWLYFDIWLSIRCNSSWLSWLNGLLMILMM
jgi:hypothetical protein